MPELFSALIVDIICLVFTLMIMRDRLAFSHPFFMYIFFHIVVVTVRGWQLYNGAPSLYSGLNQFQAITEVEIYKAIFMAVVALIVFALASWMGRYSLLSPPPKELINVQMKTMNPIYTNYVCYICLPIGLVLFIFVQGGYLHLLPNSSYFTSFAQWTVCCLLMLIFVHGFKRIYVIPTIIYLTIVAMQGYHRTQLILPIIFLTCLYLSNQKKKWPPVSFLVLAIIGFAIFPQLKHIGKHLKNDNYEQALIQLVAPFTGNKDDKNDKESNALNFLDQYAGALSLRDQADKYYYGSTYLSLVTLPIPRVLWPNKPGLADHIIETSTFSRQYSTEGRIITYIGESYFNFGYYGLLIIPGLLAFLLSRWYHRVLTYPAKSLSLCLWLVVFSSLIQVFRDGLASLITFTIMINTPLFFVALLSFTKRKLKGK